MFGDISFETPDQPPNIGGAGARPPDESDSFPEQWEYVTSESRNNAVCCGRQSGKTTGAILCAETLLWKPESRVIYATLIRRNAKKLFWWPLLDMLRAHGWHMPEELGNETEMMLWTPGGSFLQALSCEKMADLGRIRGDQADLFIIDECQEPRDDVLGALITKIVPAMLMRRRGRLDMLGTVPEVEPCVFSNRLDGIDESGGKLRGWRTFGWNAFQNKFMDKGEITRTCEDAGLVPGHPIYEREILGRRVKDPSKLAYEYDSARNVYDPAPNGEAIVWAGARNSIGIDLGFSDHDSIVVGSYMRHDEKRRLSVRWAWQHNHLDVDDLGGVVEVVLRRFPGNVVGDHGGHGATKVLETLGNRMHVNMHVKPPDVMTSVGLVNDELRSGRLQLPSQDIETKELLKTLDALIASGKDPNNRPRDSERDARTRELIIAGGNAPLAKELGMVQKSVNPISKKLEVNKRGFHSDLSEALRYMHHGARHWANRLQRGELTRNERRAQVLALRARRESDPYGD